MEFIIQIIYGFVQGVTEFLPISSSGHLVLLHKYLPLSVDNELAFDVFLHLASLLAVFLVFLPDIKHLISGSFRAIIAGKSNDDFKTARNIIISTIPAAIIGLFFGDYIENSLRSVYVVVVMLVAIGIYMLYAEKKPGNSLLSAINWKIALIIGLLQSAALIPGTSRSGITIATAMILGLTRASAVRYSFLISLPIIFGAMIVKITDVGAGDLLQYTPAFVSTFAFAFIAIKWLLKYVENKSLKAFSYYRFAIAGLILILNFI